MSVTACLLLLHLRCVAITDRSAMQTGNVVGADLTDSMDSRVNSNPSNRRQMRPPVAQRQRPWPRTGDRDRWCLLSVLSLVLLLLAIDSGSGSSNAPPRGAVGRRGRIQGFAATLYCSSASSSSSSTSR